MYRSGPGGSHRANETFAMRPGQTRSVLLHGPKRVERLHGSAEQRRPVRPFRHCSLDLVSAGDNATVIAMAARALPRTLQS
jgi:hypothetical protein